MRDRESHNAYMVGWYQTNKAHVREYRRQKRLERKAWLAEIKAERGCETCGFNDPRALQFHHKNPEDKKFTISHMLIKASEKNLLAEVDKCTILCANCHFILHHEERYGI